MTTSPRVRTTTDEQFPNVLGSQLTPLRLTKLVDSPTTFRHHLISKRLSRSTSPITTLYHTISLIRTPRTLERTAEFITELAVDIQTFPLTEHSFWYILTSPGSLYSAPVSQTFDLAHGNYSRLQLLNYALSHRPLVPNIWLRPYAHQRRAHGCRERSRGFRQSHAVRASVCTERYHQRLESQLRIFRVPSIGRMGSGDWARNTELSQDAGLVHESSLTWWFAKRVMRTWSQALE